MSSAVFSVAGAIAVGEEVGRGKGLGLLESSGAIYEKFASATTAPEPLFPMALCVAVGSRSRARDPAGRKGARFGCNLISKIFPSLNEKCKINTKITRKHGQFCCDRAHVLGRCLLSLY
jgi:hypothetical protein